MSPIQIAVRTWKAPGPVLVRSFEAFLWSGCRVSDSLCGECTRNGTIQHPASPVNHRRCSSNHRKKLFGPVFSAEALCAFHPGSRRGYISFPPHHLAKPQGRVCGPPCKVNAPSDSLMASLSF